MGALISGGQLALLQLFDFKAAGPVLKGLELEPPHAGEIAECPTDQHQHPDKDRLQGPDGEAHDA